jgi:flagellar biosynthesis protein FlhF
MEEKTFRVDDVRTGLQTIKRELGDDAVILNTQRGRDDDGRIFTEITVGVEPGPSRSDLAPKPLFPGLTSRQAPAATPTQPTKQEGGAELAALHEMVQDLVSEIRTLRGQVHDLRRREATPGKASRPSGASSARQRAARQIRDIHANRPGAGFGETMAWLVEMLTANGLLPEQVDLLIARAFQSDCGWEDEPRKLRDAVEAQMANDIRVADPLWHSRSEGRQVAVFVGPTGVGKTTTVAKVAAFAKTVGHKRVGIIAADAYRFGAVYQLERYAELLDVPLEIAGSVEAYERALDALEDCDLVLVDTTGQSPWQNDLGEGTRSELSLDVLTSLPQDDVRTGVCISATTNTRDAMALAESYGMLPSAHLNFTKLDEARCTGLLYGASVAAGLPVAHLCDGPVVPENIRETTNLEVAHLAFGG